MPATLSDVSSVRQGVEEVLETFFTQHVQAASAIHPHYADLWKSMERLFKAGGKRLRPQMLVLAYESFGGKDTSTILPIAAAHEILHLSVLIHDDIIDRDQIRYGIPNVAGQYQQIYTPYGLQETENSHYSLSAALLGGDLLISAAHQLILQSKIEDRLKILAFHQLGEGIFEVAGGELLDTEASFRGVDASDPETIARYKTIGYSFISPLLTGAYLAEASEEAIELIKSFSIAVGTAFQFADDLLGVFGDETVTGKSHDSDIREGKRTRLVQYTLQYLNDADRDIFNTAFGNQLASATDIDISRQLMITSGAQQAVIDDIQLYASEAHSVLERLPISAESKARFAELVERASKRSF